jgi:hypothetical protein
MLIDGNEEKSLRYCEWLHRVKPEQAYFAPTRRPTITMKAAKPPFDRGAIKKYDIKIL